MAVHFEAHRRWHVALTKMRLFLLIVLCILALASGKCGAAVVTLELSDEQIVQAIHRGESTDVKKLWKQIQKAKYVRINRPTFGDVVMKAVTFIGDADRIALIANDRRRRLQNGLTVTEVRSSVPFGFIEVRLDSIATGIYAPKTAKWSAPVVDMVLKADGVIIQPEEEMAGETHTVSGGRQEIGILQRSGPIITYTPIYAAGIYDSSVVASWFKFPAIAPPNSLVVMVISGEGKVREKTLDPKVLR
jgi:hypothetical protein